MNENFSDDLKRVLKLSKNEANRLGHSYIGSEHFLLGIMKDKNGKASKLISKLGINNSEIISYIETISKPKSGSVALGHLPLTRRAEKILRNTQKEAKNKNKNTADQIDFLLSIASEKEGLAFEALSTFSK